jgi:uncharacterized protein YjbI with pentapeptide repeats
MGNPKTYTLQEVFNSTYMGFVLEFYSSKDVNFIVKNLSELTLKNVTLTNELHHEPTYTSSVLVKEYEGDKPRYSLHIAQQDFNSATPLLKNTLKWISETAECTRDTVMRVNMSFDNKHLKTLSSISGMSAHKLIMKFDESYAFQRFPKQKDSPYCMSVKQMSHINENVYTGDMVKNVTYIIGIPKENYFGINFKDQTMGILEFNYIGGQNYAYKEKEVMEMLEYYVLKTYQSLNEADYNRSETNELRDMTEKFYSIQEAYYDPEVFTTMFPDIRVAVNLRRDTQLLKSFWPKIRSTLFEMVVNNGMTQGQFNYDTDISRYQLHQAELKCNNISDFDLVKCKVSGIIERCNLWTCEITNARLMNSKVVKGSNVSDSYLRRVSVSKDNIVEGCFIENNNELLDCTIKESVVKFAGIGKFANLDESTVVIGNETKMEVAKGVESDVIKDYKWLQKLSSKEQTSHVYGNTYIKKRFL